MGEWTHSDGGDAEASAASAARARRRRPLTRRALAWGLGRAALLVAVALALAFASRGETGPGVDVTVLLVLAFALCWRDGFETPTGVTVPRILALCPMFVLLPAGWIPLAAAAGGVLGDVRTEQQLRRMLGSLSFALAVVPAALVLLVLAPQPGWSGAPAYALALAVWVAADAVQIYLHQRLVIGNRGARLSGIAAMYAIEIPLGAVAFLGAMESDRFRYAFLVPLAMLAVVRRLTAERRSRIDQADALSRAYRGTAILLGSAIDADDGYTGQHSRGVVDLVRAVAEELGLPDAEVQRAEFTALLHDIGKIHVPKAILHKPGPLTPAEWDVVKRHPDDGARMLREVGGYLADIGALVRHHHERWDGGGYPDGLAGDAIPLVSRIVCACDAFSAMTTDRSYRPAQTNAFAVAELHRGADSQFDPAVVETLCRVLAREVVQRIPGGGGAVRLPLAS